MSGRVIISHHQPSMQSHHTTQHHTTPLNFQQLLATATATATATAKPPTLELLRLVHLVDSLVRTPALAHVVWEGGCRALLWLDGYVAGGGFGLWGGGVRGCGNAGWGGGLSEM